MLYRSILTLTLCLVASMAQAADWATLKMKFVLDGDAPKPATLPVTKDVAVCGKTAVDESLVVDAKTGAIQNIIVYLYQLSDEGPPPIHESYKAQASKTLTLDNKKCRFVPRVTTLWQSQKLELSNSDTAGHNTKIDTLNNDPINPLLPAGAKYPVSFEEAERLPSGVSCSIHPWMKAWVLIKNNPYMAVSDENGVVEIANVPPGEWKFQVWHERSGYVKNVTLEKAETDRRGRLELTIPASGVVDLGTGKVPVDLFEE